MTNLEIFDGNYITEEMRMFRKLFRQFVEKECVPHRERWKKEGMVDRELWYKAGEAGFLCPAISTEYGGGGEFVSAIAMTEPDTGSDLQAIRTTAIADGDDYVINGQKMFISNGQQCDIIVVVAKTIRSAWTCRTPQSCFSATCGCRKPTCSVRPKAWVLCN